MSRNTSISLDDHFERFVDEKVAAGEYASVSEVLRSSLRLLEEHELKKTHLRSLLTEGERSGTITSDAYTEIFEKHRRNRLSKDS